MKSSKMKKSAARERNLGELKDAYKKSPRTKKILNKVEAGAH